MDTKHILKKIGYDETDIESELLLLSVIEDKEERDIELDKFILRNPKYSGGYFQKDILLLRKRIIKLDYTILQKQLSYNRIMKRHTTTVGLHIFI